MLESIEKRISRRKFSTATIEDSVWEKIQERVDSLNRESLLDFEIVRDAGKAFSSMKKSYGLFSGVKSCAVLKGNSSDPDFLEKVGYFGEDLVLFLTELNFGTCWVGVTFGRSDFSVPEGESLVCVIPFGYVEDLSVKERLIRKLVSAKRKPARERLENYDDAPDWVKKAMNAVVLAPSAMNSQRPIFHFRDGKITADVPAGTKLNFIDLGIAKKHFELEAQGKFSMGNGADFTRQQ